MGKCCKNCALLSGYEMYAKQEDECGLFIGFGRVKAWVCLSTFGKILGEIEPIIVDPERAGTRCVLHEEKSDD